ncbi:MAG: beta-N-acetylhexosaminidase [Bacteroidetes bacterium]|nr:beta-N-acetylhexosaminidase [Bacteroidota bacterium]
MKKLLFLLLTIVIHTSPAISQANSQNDFFIKGFHLDLRIQVMTMDALRNFASKLKQSGINTLIMEWEATYPFSKHPLIPNKYAYTKNDIISFIKFCNDQGIDVIPLQQSFGHVEYILRHYRYKDLREDQKNYSQVCPSQPELNKKLFTDLFTELASTHTSKYFHIGGDETYLLGHCPLCKKKAAEEGISKLYIDHIRMLCDIIIKLGKRPVLWADIALKHPEALPLLPKETIFIDWNYGWDLNYFGDHQRLLQSGFEIWGAPSMRSHPDNYFLTLWQKHFNNIHDFIPAARKMNYKGIVMTAWSTSGEYDTRWESSSDIFDLYAIRHVYPITGFNMLFAAYAESLKSPQPLAIENFITKYCAESYGFNKEQADMLWKALRTAPYEVEQGKVLSPSPISIKELSDSARMAIKILSSLHPQKNVEEFEQYKLMADIRLQYLEYEQIENEVNDVAFTKEKAAGILSRLKGLMSNADEIGKRFINLNKNYYNEGELKEENESRNMKIKLLYEKLMSLNRE